MNATATAWKATTQPRRAQSSRPELSVVTQSAPRVGGRHTVTAIVASVTLLLATILGITSYTSHLAMAAKPLHTELSVLQEQNQALTEELNKRSSAAWLGERAKELGMVPYADYGYVNLEKNEITGGTAAH
ncbi:hypothetical protein BSR29_03735 [Boudabousia liubingyangii]|uniref:Cell division protein FtsL n=1 Tax=Boudabousia liubingyangii TaxID=1921764 RepID=A0A1Q5PN46_9ACTO|nr:hypothetical protein [Boudabousia liubingyangii]OKL47538.1 hypothetical protein BSR28_03305 [Boudabousia liubingyangii]OKL48962.1 hypothetical protein BSR29_03735 [Boudabousia liubingyangii]